MTAETKLAKPSISDDELAMIISLRHADPHAVLGAHPTPEGVSIRAFYPAAERIVILSDGHDGIEMTRRHPAGFFEGLLKGAKAVPAYRLEVHYPHGDVHTFRDAYAFLPTLGDVDLHLLAEGRHERAWEKLGAHRREINGVQGISFAVWAPNVAGVSVVGNFNSWDGRLHPMRSLGSSGVWELFIPDLQPGALYKYEVRLTNGGRMLHADPYAQQTELPPGTASKVFQPSEAMRDGAWLEKRRRTDWAKQPVSIYECHLGSWRRLAEEGNRPLTYREIAPQLADYLTEMGFTHVEFLPLAEHPFGGSWGYQVSGFFAPTARFGSPDDFRFLVNYLHERGIGVILDWVPAHFPKDEWALARFIGEALYEHADSRLGEHPDWGTYIFNYGRHEVRNFLVANALFWLDQYHVDGLRVDAVASMLYLDYSRKDGQWVANKYGGRENLEAIALLKEVNGVVHTHHRGTMMVAEESTAWPNVSKPTSEGGLGFDFKWNMGWMNDTLKYFKEDPIHRQYHHGKLTFGLMYAWSENFILPLSHDEVVHGKGSLVDKMPGDRWQKMANLRALYGYMWAHPGKKMLFMGGELAQWKEWNHDASLDWHLLAEADHKGVQTLVKDLNHLYRQNPALWSADTSPEGFQWLSVDAAQENMVAFFRRDPQTDAYIVCVANFSPVPRQGYRLGLPAAGRWVELLNTDATVYGGSNLGNAGAIETEAEPWQGQDQSALVTLPPLGVFWLAMDAETAATHQEAMRAQRIEEARQAQAAKQAEAVEETKKEQAAEPIASAKPLAAPPAEPPVTVEAVLHVAAPVEAAPVAAAPAKPAPAKPVKPVKHGPTKPGKGKGR